MNILDAITAHKRKEVELLKATKPIKELEREVLFERSVISVAKRIKQSSSGIIAEFKRKSPSKSVINNEVKVADVVKGYEMAGASAISVLTDEKYFGGTLQDLLTARASVSIPLLRKEFMVDEYQIIEAKAAGADFILLIAASLSSIEIQRLAKLAKTVGLEVLMEVHSKIELLDNLFPEIDIIGVNNRNLKTMEVDIRFSQDLAAEIPIEFVKISESGISNFETVIKLKQYGYQGFLIGENFMKTGNPGLAAKEFINRVENGN